MYREPSGPQIRLQRSSGGSLDKALMEWFDHNSHRRIIDRKALVDVGSQTKSN